MNTMQDNPLFKKGYKGFSMVKKDGSGNTVPFEQVGLLAQKLHSMLEPLRSGPFGGDGQPASKAVSEIKMEIRAGPLDVTQYETIDAFVLAIDALPNPAPAAAPAADEPSIAEMKEAITTLFNGQDRIGLTIKLLQDEVGMLRRELDVKNANARRAFCGADA